MRIPIRIKLFSGSETAAPERKPMHPLIFGELVFAAPKKTAPEISDAGRYKCN